MLVDAAGEIDAYQFYPAVMCSHARFTYTEVAAILGNTRGPEAQRRSELVPHLIHLHEVYRALLKQRGTRGAVDFETTETQIVCDDNGRIERIEPRKRNEAHRLIEEAMLAANVCAAEFIAEARAPGAVPRARRADDRKAHHAAELPEGDGPGHVAVRRPDARRVAGDRRAPRATGPTRRRSTRCCCARCSRRIYTAANSGHFGLAYEAYTHFTSPIRRYPDLLVHRVIKALLQGKRYHLDTGALEDAPKARSRARQAPQALAPRAQELEQWNAAGAHCSTNERRADEASRDVEAWLKCRYMRERLGEEFNGTVSAVVPFGLFVTLDDAVRRRPAAHHRDRRRLLPLRRGAAGTARRAQRHALRRRHARARAGEPRRPRQPAHRLSHGARGRRANACCRAAASPSARSPQAELAAVRARDRAAKSSMARAAKARPRVEQQEGQRQEQPRTRPAARSAPARGADR